MTDCSDAESSLLTEESYESNIYITESSETSELNLACELNESSDEHSEESSLNFVDNLTEDSQETDSSNLDSYSSDSSDNFRTRCERCNLVLEDFYGPNTEEEIATVWLELVLEFHLEEPGYYLCPQCN